MVRLSVQLVLAASLASFVAATPVSRPKVFSIPVRAPTFEGLTSRDIVAHDLARWSMDAAADITVPINDAVTHYLADITVDDQPFSVIITSGMANTWIGAGTEFNTSGAIDSGTNVTAYYGFDDVWFTGREYTANVSLGEGLTISNQSIGVATSWSGFTGVDGMLGIGPVGLTNNTDRGLGSIPTVLDNLFSQGTIPLDVIGVAFSPYDGTESSPIGELDFGGVDESKFVGPMTWVRVSGNWKYSWHWAVSVTATSYGGSQIKERNSASIDTAISSIFLSSKAYRAFLADSGGTYNQSDLTYFTSPPTGNLTFTIGGTDYSLSPSQYLVPESQYGSLGLTEGFYYAWIGYGGTIAYDVDYVLGQKFIENFYVAYDASNNRIGLAPRAT